MSKDLPLLVLYFHIISCRNGIECLHCFNCSHVQQSSDCDNVLQCKMDESCFIERNVHGNDTEYALGCMPMQTCPDEHQFTIVGRSVTTHCIKCCSRDGCNKQYCEPPHDSAPRTTAGSCIDDPTQNCSTLASVVDICSTPQRAKVICRRYCGLCGMVDGNWGQWRGWSTCSTTCGMGVESRTRECNDPAPAHGGYDCPGKRTQQQSCFQLPCPVHGEWNSWASWEQCSASCGPGLKKRHRTCTNPPPSFDGHSCLGDNVEYDLCEGRHCGNYTTMGTPLPTASTCKDLIDCGIANATVGICNNFDEARKMCEDFCGLCGMVNGGWASWSHWGSCTTSCGIGSVTRTRTCSKPPPQNGGKTCPGMNFETKHCSLRACPVHGGWGMWSHWSSCSSACGPGITRRSRMCDNPRLQLLGNICFGDSSDIGICLIKPCPVNGGWTDWSYWSGCSVTCGNGHAVRQRSCSNPTSANGGVTCAGQRLEQKTCNITSCPGGMSAFTVTYPVAGPRVNTIRFTHVITNIGGNYDTTTSVFTCQYPGLYVFALHLMKHHDRNSVWCAIMKNGSYLVYVFSDPDAASDGRYSGGTNSVVVHLVRGDRVDIGDCSSIANIYVHNHGETSFSGFLLKAD